MSKIREDIERSFELLKKDFGLHCTEILQVRPYVQQWEFINAVNAIWQAKHKKRVLKMPLTPEEERLNAYNGVSIMAGRGVGKEAVVAWFIDWVQTYFTPHEIMCTGPSADHLKTVLWPEIYKWKFRKDDDGYYISPFANDFDYTKTAIYRKGGIDPLTKIRYNDREINYCHYKTVQLAASAEQQADGLSGHHQEHIVFITDEGASLTYPVFNTLISSLTREEEVGLLINIFNPTRNHGPAYDIHYGTFGDTFLKLRWNLEECEGIDPKVIEDARRFGVNSSYYRVNILGLPPLADQDKVIPWSFIQTAKENKIIDNEESDVIAMIDPAGEGKDATIIGFRQGNKFIDFFYINKTKTDEIVDDCIDKIDEFNASRVYIDKVGVGLGVFSYLEKHYGRTRRVYGINVRNSSRKPDKYFCLRDELWWTMRESFEKGAIEIPDNGMLTAELNTVGYTIGSKGIIKIDGKQKIRKELGRSCDYADTMILSYYHDFTRYDANAKLRAAPKKRPWEMNKLNRKPWTPRTNPYLPRKDWL